MQQHAKSLFIQRILLQDPGFKAKMHVIIQQMQQQKTPQASTSEVSQGDGKPIGPQPTVAQIRQPGSAGQVPLARIVHGNHATTTFVCHTSILSIPDMPLVFYPDYPLDLMHPLEFCL